VSFCEGATKGDRGRVISLVLPIITDACGSPSETITSSPNISHIPVRVPFVHDSEEKSDSEILRGIIRTITIMRIKNEIKAEISSTVVKGTLIVEGRGITQVSGSLSCSFP
jgi:hypothetical protein